MFLKKYRENLCSQLTIFTLLAIATTVFCFGINTITTNAQTTTKNVPFDFTGDSRSDWATVANYFSTTTGPITWKVAGNPAPAAPNAAFIRYFNYGINTQDTIVAADYTGDRKTDPTVWRLGTPGIFYVAQFPSGIGGIVLDRAIRFGAATDTPVEGGDYDGDGKADYTIVRINADNTVTWFIKNSTTGAERAINFGSVAGIEDATFFPGADFTGDGRDELIFATANPTTGFVTYYVGDANTGVGVLTRQFGNFNSDYSLAPADYTGDRRADFVAVRQSSALGQQTWYINNSATNATTARGFGIPDTSSARVDIQVRGDYDGDGIHDICVWRVSNQTFYYLRSSSNNTVVDGQKWGDPGDFPLGGLGSF